jgi:hypothetical protein
LVSFSHHFAPGGVQLSLFDNALGVISRESLEIVVAFNISC